MSTGPTTLPENGLSTPVATRRGLPRLRDARIRSKLALLLVVPVAAVLALATVRLVDVGSSARDADLVRSLTALSTNVSGLSQYLHKERMAAAALLASPDATPDQYNVQVGLTDQRVAAYRGEREDIGDLPTAVEERLRRVDDHLKALNGTRKEVLDRTQMPVAEVVLRYGVVITDLVAYGDVLGQLAGDTEIADSLRAVAAFARAKAATAEQEAVTFAALVDGQLDEEQYSSFVATLTGQQEALEAFSLAARPTQRALVNSTVTGDAVVLADQTASQLSRSVGGPPGISAPDAARSIGAVADLMRWAEIRLEQQLVADADEASASVTRQAALEGIIVLLTLLVAIVLAVVIARSLNRALRLLREGALSVANRDLPDAVARLRDVRGLGEGAAEDIARQIKDPIHLPNRDEIGQVAQAFNVVHREAVRIAAEQAAMRTSVSAMFLNLARRSQALVDRMIGELDTLERTEEDPKRLAQLFELDHLATRMRRNDENLLVLAGADSSPPRREDALVIDALRAAQSEVELYNRVEFGTVDTDISIAAHAVNDVVRLIAELLDNATRFSPPTTVVVADGRRIRDYVVVQVEDRGLGMSEEQMAALNRRLAQPPTVDVGAFRLMGLAVVGRLASRYGIRVELRANIEGGTVAQVTLPTSIVVLPRTRSREQVGAGARAPRAVERGPSTAARPSLAAAAAGGWTPAVSPAPAPTGHPTFGNGSRAEQPAGWAAFGTPRPESSNPGTPRERFAGAGAQRPDGAGLAGQDTQIQPAVVDAVRTDPATAPRSVGPVTSGLVPQERTPNVGTPTVAFPTLPPPRPEPARAEPGRSEPGRQDSDGNVIAPTVHQLTPVGASLASAGQQDFPAPFTGNGWGAALAAMPPAPPPPHLSRRTDDRVEAPIFRAMEAVWFRAHDQDTAADWGTPTAGYAPPPATGAEHPGRPAGATGPAGTTGTGRTGVGGGNGVDSGRKDIGGGHGASLGAAAPGAPEQARAGGPDAGSGGPSTSGPTFGNVPVIAGRSGAGPAGDAGNGSARTADSGPATPPVAPTDPARDRPTPAGNNAPTDARRGPDAARGSDGGLGSDAARGTDGGLGSDGARGADGGRGADAGRDADLGRGPGRPAGLADATAPLPTVPRPRTPVEDGWRTAADEGWTRASAAAEPATGGTTRSGLPKRVPQAQLVPGGIEARSTADRARRTPDEVRGLLSAYHRGVQRGRSAGTAEAAVGDPPLRLLEETDQ